MAYFLIECPPDTPHDTFDHIRRFMGSNIPSPHQFLVYTGTPGDYGLKISVILNDNESLASLYDNVKEITSVADAEEPTAKRKPDYNADPNESLPEPSPNVWRTIFDFRKKSGA